MRIHHLNCISTCPLGGALMDGSSLGSLGWWIPVSACVTSPIRTAG